MAEEEPRQEKPGTPPFSQVKEVIEHQQRRLGTLEGQVSQMRMQRRGARANDSNEGLLTIAGLIAIASFFLFIYSIWAHDFGLMGWAIAGFLFFIWVDRGNHASNR